MAKLSPLPRLHGGLHRGTLVELGQRWYDPTTGHFTEEETRWPADTATATPTPGDSPVDTIGPTGKEGVERYLFGVGMIAATVAAVAALPEAVRLYAAVMWRPDRRRSWRFSSRLGTL